MNLPNKLTVLRILMTPFFLLALLWEFPHHYLVALFLFALASLTDMIDGNLARKYGLITDFGKFLDPLADKMLTTAAFLGFIALGIGTGVVWITFIVLIREFLITSLRLVAVSSGGKVIAANSWGKAKTISQMVAIIFAIFVRYLVSLDLFDGNTIKFLSAGVDAVLWISAVLTVISGTIYLLENMKFVNTSK